MTTALIGLIGVVVGVVLGGGVQVVVARIDRRHVARSAARSTATTYSHWARSASSRRLSSGVAMKPHHRLRAGALSGRRWLDSSAARTL